MGLEKNIDIMIPEPENAPRRQVGLLSILPVVSADWDTEPAAPRVFVPRKPAPVQPPPAKPKK
jgi:hypothetical protein